MERTVTDQFDRFLAEALAPEAREPDRIFVARVQAGIALERQLRAERRSLFRRVGVETIAIAAVALALLWLGRAPPVAGFVTDSPAIALVGLLSVFSLLVLLFSRQTDEPRLSKV